MRIANLILKFLLELAAFAALAFWGASTGDGAGSVALAILAPSAAIAAWGLYAAPRSPRRLPAASRIPFELAIFALAVAALVVAGEPDAAEVLGLLVVVNAALLTILDQWEA